MFTLLNRINAIYSWLISLLIVIVIAVADFYTGDLVTLSAFYILPLFVIAWTRSKVETHILILVIISAWSLANYFSDVQHLSPAVICWNFFIRWLHLTLTAELISYIRRLLDINANLANIDSLTGIPNRRAFTINLQRVFSNDPETKLVLFTLIDIDFFKGINDKHGHQFGDEVLKKVSLVLKHECMRHEFCGRLGGDEFAILLYCEDIPDSMNRIRRLSIRLAEDATPCSLGTAIMSKDQLLPEVFESADKSLYETKFNGRGFATMFDGIEFHKLN